MKRRTKILIGLVLLAGIGLLALKPRDQPRRALEEYKKQLITRGEKLTIAELIPPPSTKTPNGASNFLSATNLTFNTMDLPSMMRIVAPGVAMISHTNFAPELTLNYEQNKQRAAELRGLLNVAVLDFNLDYAKGINLLLPHLAKVRNDVLLADGTAMQALYAHDQDEAWSDLNASVDLFRLVKNDIMELSAFVRLAVAPIAVAATWEVLQSDQCTDAQLSALQARWMDVDFFSSSEAMLNMERAISIGTMMLLRTNYDEAMMTSSAMNTATNASTIPGLAGEFGARIRDKLGGLYNRFLRYPLWKSSWSYEEERYYLQMLGAGVAASHHAKTTGAFVPAVHEFSQEMTNINSFFQSSHEHFLLGWGSETFISKFLIRLADAEVARRLLVTAIALKRFQLQHGSYPATLEELVPAFLPRVPADLMDGKPLRYRIRPEGGFLLYSVGEDGEDNGGDATPVGGKGWLQGRDIVWPRPATPAEAADYLNRTATTNAAGR